MNTGEGPAILADSSMVDEAIKDMKARSLVYQVSLLKCSRHLGDLDHI